MPTLAQMYGAPQRAATPLDNFAQETLTPLAEKLAPKPMPEVNPGIISLTGRALGGGLGAVGNLLDLPGSSVRDVLALKNPLDQWMDPLGYSAEENRVTGRDLLRQYGMVGEKDTWGNFAAGFAVDVATDPLTFTGIGNLNKAGTVAKNADMLGYAREVGNKTALDIAKENAQKAAKAAGDEGSLTAKLTRPMRNVGAQTRVTPQEIFDHLQKTDPDKYADVYQSWKNAGGTDELLNTPLRDVLSFRIPGLMKEPLNWRVKDPAADRADWAAKNSEFVGTPRDPNAPDAPVVDTPDTGGGGNTNTTTTTTTPTSTTTTTTTTPVFAVVRTAKGKVDYAKTREAFRSLSPNHESFDEQLKVYEKGGALTKDDSLFLQSIYSGSDMDFSNKMIGAVRKMEYADGSIQQLGTGYRINLIPKNTKAVKSPITTLNHEMGHMAMMEMEKVDPELFAAAQREISEAIADGSLLKKFSISDNNGTGMMKLPSGVRAEVRIAEYFQNNPHEAFAQMFAHAMNSKIPGDAIVGGGAVSKLLAETWEKIKTYIAKVVGSATPNDPRLTTIEKLMDYAGGFKTVDDRAGILDELNRLKAVDGHRVKFFTEAGAQSTGRTLVERAGARLGLLPPTDDTLLDDSFANVIRVEKETDGMFRVDIDEQKLKEAWPVDPNFKQPTPVQTVSASNVVDVANPAFTFANGKLASTLNSRLRQPNSLNADDVTAAFEGIPPEQHAILADTIKQSRPDLEQYIPQGVGAVADDIAEVAESIAVAGAEESEKVAARQAWKEQGTKSPFFKRFFGDWETDPVNASKVVDAEGKPVEMYHGTGSSGFSSFDTYGSKYGLMGLGSYFTDNIDVATGYSKTTKGKTPGIYKVFLDIKNPLDMDAVANKEAWARVAGDYLDQQALANIKTNEDAFRAIEETLSGEMIPSYEGAEMMQDIIRNMGHDGVTHIGGGRAAKNGVAHRVFIAFDPNQIKSSKSNSGEFSKASDDILESISPDDALRSDQEKYLSISQKLAAAYRAIEKSSLTQEQKIAEYAKLDDLHDQSFAIQSKYMDGQYDNPIDWQVSSSNEVSPRLKPITKHIQSAYFPINDDMRQALPVSDQLRPMSLKERMAALKDLHPEQYETSTNGFGAAFAEHMGGAMDGNFSGIEGFAGAGLDAEWVSDVMSDSFIAPLRDAFKQTPKGSSARKILAQFTADIARGLDAAVAAQGGKESIYKELRDHHNFSTSVDDLFGNTDMLTRQMPGSYVKAADFAAERIKAKYGRLAPDAREAVRKVIAPLIDSFNSVDGSRFVDELEPDWNMGRQGRDDILESISPVEALQKFGETWKSKVPEDSASAVADFLDRGGDLFYATSAGRALAGLFNADLFGAANSEIGREMGRARAQAMDEATIKFREAIDPVMSQLSETAQLDLDALLRAGKTEEEALKHINKISNSIFQYLEGVEGLDKAIDSPELVGSLEALRKIKDDVWQKIEDAGLKAPDLQDFFVQHFPRRKVDPSKSSTRINPRSGPVVEVSVDSMKKRDELFRDIPGGTAALNDLSLDPIISGALHRPDFMKRKLSVEDIAKEKIADGDVTMREYVARLYGDRLLTPEKLAAFDPEKSTDLDAFIQYFAKLDPKYADNGMPMFGRNPIGDMANYMSDGNRVAAMATTTQQLIGRAARMSKHATEDNKLHQIEKLIGSDGLKFENTGKVLLNITKHMEPEMQQAFKVASDKEISDVMAQLAQKKEVKRFVDGNEYVIKAKDIDANGNVLSVTADYKKTARTLANGEVTSELKDIQDVVDFAANPDYLRKMTEQNSAKQFLSEFGVEDDVYKDATRFMKPWTSPDEYGIFERGLRRYINVMKAGLTAPWPAFHVRNFVSGSISNAMLGLTDPRYKRDLTGRALWQPIKDAYDLRGNKPIDLRDLAEYGAKDAEGNYILSAEDAMKKFQSEIFSMGIIGEKMGLAAEFIGDDLSSLGSQKPGMNANVNPIRGKFSPAPPGRTWFDYLNPLATRDGFTVGKGADGKLTPEVVRRDMFGGATAGKDVASFVEDLNRISGYIASRRQGASPRAARAAVNKAQVDYSKLSSFESRYMRLMVPFYSYSRGTLPVTTMELIQNPGGPMATTIKLANRSRNPEEIVPDHIASTVGIPMGETSDGSKRYLTGFGLGFEDSLNLLNGPLRLDPMETFREIGGRTNPAVKGSIETMMGRSLFQDGPVGGKELTDLDPTIGRTLTNIRDLATGERTKKAPPFIHPLVEQVVSNSPASRFASTARTLTDPRKWENPVTGLGMNLLTGARVNDVSPQAQDAIYSERLARELKEMGGRTYQRPYLSDEREAQMTPEERARGEAILGEIDKLGKRFKSRRENKEREEGKLKSVIEKGG